MIEQTVQNSLNNLEKDCKTFRSSIQKRLELNTEARNRNFNRSIQSESYLVEQYIFELIFTQLNMCILLF